MSLLTLREVELRIDWLEERVNKLEEEVLKLKGVDVRVNSKRVQELSKASAESVCVDEVAKSRGGPKSRGPYKRNGIS